MANIRHNLIIDAPLKQIYDALTSEAGLKGWWTEEVDARPEEGYINQFRFGNEYFKKMEISKLMAPIKVYWRCTHGDKEWIGTELSFELEKREDKTLLLFSHLNWSEESEFFGYCNHHWGRYLDSLKSLCETGKGQPYTK